ncbi:MAG: NifU family protein [Sphingobacteriia bacterium]|nr:NifU family protein [Sphingobacteriia bacterium]
MFIQVELTPNPLTLKFIPGEYVTGSEPVNIPSKETAYKSPLAEELFKIQDVEGIFLGYDFITVTKNEAADWNILKAEILTTIMDFYVSGKAILNDKANTTIEVSSENDTDIVKQIKEIIETRVRPAVAQDGGDIIFVEYEDGIVRLELHGACSGCPSSTITLKSGIENMLKYYVPEVVAVEAV